MMKRAYGEVVGFIAAGCTPADVVAFRPSEEARQRIEQLIRMEKNGALTPEETSELDTCMRLEHLMRLAKARAGMNTAT